MATTKFELKGFEEITSEKMVRQIGDKTYTIKEPTLKQWGEYVSYNDDDEDILSLWAIGQLVEGETFDKEHLQELAYVCRSLLNVGVIAFKEVEAKRAEEEKQETVEDDKPAMKLAGGAETKTVAQFGFILSSFIKYLGMSKKEALEAPFFPNQELVRSFEVYRERDKADNMFALRATKMLENKEGVQNYRSTSKEIQNRIEKGSYKQITLKADMSILEMMKAHQQAGGR